MTDRFRDTLTGALLSRRPVPALRALVASDVCADRFPELPAMAMPDGAGRHKDVLDHSIRVAAKTPPRLVVRLAGLCHDIGKPATRRFDGSQVTFHGHEAVGARLLRRRLPAVGFGADVTRRVATIVALSGRFKGYGGYDPDGDGGWSDTAVRRYVRDAGDVLEDLLALSAVDVTSRHRHKHVRQVRQVAALRERIAAVAAADDRAAERPDLDGRDVMSHLGIGPGPQVGRILAALLDAKRTAGRPLTRDEAYALVDRHAGRSG